MGRNSGHYIVEFVVGCLGWRVQSLGFSAKHSGFVTQGFASVWSGRITAPTMFSAVTLSLCFQVFQIHGS